MSNRLFVRCVAVVSLAVCRTTSAVAKDYFLTIGGGYDVTGNQLSLEKNILFQQSVLAAQRPDKPPYEVWFADGNDPHPDVQCRDPEVRRDLPRSRGESWPRCSAMPTRWTSCIATMKCPSLKGPADLKARRSSGFAELASEVKSGDRVIIYVAGHGGRAKRPERRRAAKSAPNRIRTTRCFYFWNTEPVTASEFTGWLDRFPRDARSRARDGAVLRGRFCAHDFRPGRRERGTCRPMRGADSSPRCTIAAPPAARPMRTRPTTKNTAATSGARWPASRASARRSTSADYDKNGQVSFAEAHAYAMIESDTIDVPVRTSGALLRQYSQIGKPAKKSDRRQGRRRLRTPTTRSTPT